MTPLVLIASLLAAPAQQPDPETRWYGAQTLLSDAAAVGLGFAAAHAENRGSAALFAASTAFYFVGAPIVHFVHGRGDAGGNSLGMRLWIPLGLGLAGAGVGALAQCQPSTGGEPGLRGLDDCVVLGAIAGVAAGALTASLIDALILAREPVAEPRIAPQVGWMRDRSGDLHPSFGLAARF